MAADPREGQEIAAGNVATTTASSIESPPRVDAHARVTLERWVRASTTPQRVVRRSSIVLFAMDGVSCDEIAARVGVSRPTVKLWITRFEDGGPESLLHDAPGRGRPATIDSATIRERLQKAALLDSHGDPVSLRRAAAFLNVSTSAVWRALRKSDPLTHVN
jgi:transposase